MNLKIWEKLQDVDPFSCNEHMARKIIPMISDDNRAIVQYYCDTFDSEKAVSTHYDEPETSIVYIFRAPDCPAQGIVSYATIGVSDVELNGPKGVVDFRLELVFAAKEDQLYARNILSTASFCIMKDAWPCFPGASFPDVFSMYDSTWTVKHACFVDLFLWDKSPATMQLSDKKVAFLQLIGITDAEFDFLHDNEFEALQAQLEFKNADVFDFNRDSVV